MKSKSKYRHKKLSEISRKSKIIIFCCMMSVIISFVGYLAIATFLRGSENLNELTHVTGSVNQIRMMKHKYVGKYKTIYEDVIVLRIDGSNDEFGFMEYNKIYNKLLSLPREGKKLYANIYYDRFRKRIEQNVTLHTFDLTINGEKYVDIKNVKRTELTGSIIFFALTLALLYFTVIGVKRIYKTGIII